MSTVSSLRRLFAVIAGCAVLATAGFAAAAPTGASPDEDPDDPMAFCLNQAFGAVCDNPIDPDNTFKRCKITDAFFAHHGLYIPRRQSCWVVDLNGNPDFGDGLPQYHIEP